MSRSRRVSPIVQPVRRRSSSGFFGAVIAALCVLAGPTNAWSQMTTFLDAGPDPFYSSDSIYLNVSTYWYLWDCPWCWNDYVEAEVDGSDGPTWYDASYPSYYGDSGSAYFYFTDFDARLYMQPVSYTAYTTIWYYDAEYGSYNADWDVAFESVYPGDPAPEIDGPPVIWWFNGESPSGYATTAELTSSAGSSTEWSVISGPIQLSNTSGSTTTVSATGGSTGYNDAVVRATSMGGSTDHQMTVYWPKSLTFMPAESGTECPVPTWGYETHLFYSVRDFKDYPVPSAVPVNEAWTTGVFEDYAGTDWRQGDPLGVTSNQGGVFYDRIQGEEANRTPAPQCGNDTSVQHWGQEWRVGSLTSGQGQSVQTNTLYKTRQRGHH